MRRAGSIRDAPAREMIVHICALLLCLLHVHDAPTTQPRVVRCAVIHGMIDVQFWPELAARFEKQTGIKIETVAFGEKMTIDQAFHEGGIDLISLHASDKIINLVADGWAMDPQPWCRNDMVLIGPPDDPAGIGDPDDELLGESSSS
jgi:tungstate transport system substrate-binding protein